MSEPIDYDRAVQEHRKHLVEALHSASRDYDQAILTVAAATLAVSVTFAHDITPHPAPGSTPLLAAAWFFLIVAVLFIVGSFLTSQVEIWRQIDELDDEKDYSLGRAGWVTLGLTVLAGLWLSVGLILLGLYALANMASLGVTP